MGKATSTMQNYSKFQTPNILMFFFLIEFRTTKKVQFYSQNQRVVKRRVDFYGKKDLTSITLQR